MKSPNKPDKETLDKWHKNPSNWILGIFYYNKNDYRMFPPKRTMLGWTINFANTYSVFGIVCIIGLLIVLSELNLRRVA